MDAENYSTWNDFSKKHGPNITFQGGNRIIGPEGSLLADNLESILRYIKVHFYNNRPDIRNILLYLHNGQNAKVPVSFDKEFQPVLIDYSLGLSKVGKYINLT